MKDIWNDVETGQQCEVDQVVRKERLRRSEIGEHLIIENGPVRADLECRAIEAFSERVRELLSSDDWIGAVRSFTASRLQLRESLPLFPFQREQLLILMRAGLMRAGAESTFAPGLPADRG